MCSVYLLSRNNHQFIRLSGLLLQGCLGYRLFGWCFGVFGHRCCSQCEISLHGTGRDRLWKWRWSLKLFCRSLRLLSVIKVVRSVEVVEVVVVVRVMMMTWKRRKKWVFGNAIFSVGRFQILKPQIGTRLNSILNGKASHICIANGNRFLICKHENEVWNIFGGKLAWGPVAIVCDDPNFQGRGGPSSGDIFHATPNVDHSQYFVRTDVKVLLSRSSLFNSKVASNADMKMYRKTDEAVHVNNTGGLIWISDWNALQHPVASASLVVVYSDYMLTSRSQKIQCDAYTFTTSDLENLPCHRYASHTKA
ncbi:glycosyl hydrolase 9B5 [Tanacetum coccineum]|uniref:Glycosyl hydrolase 9B5 n=1 Tax=Tanacetum coccineum TaxID=301880 RepID=A0ABQ4WUB5_9ASTR